MPTLAIMSTSHPIDTAWRTFWVLKKQRPEPTWARLLITTALGLSIGVILVTLAGLFSGNVGRWAWWRINLAANLVVCLCIAYTMHALYRSLELLLTEAALQRITSWRDWRAGVFFSILGISGALLGGILGLAWISLLFQVDAWATFTAQPRAIRNFLVITALITLVNWIYWRWHSKRQSLQLQATESQLRLLQGQIEPHFLFNTLANVRSLMDYDPAVAKAMLEAFTDYLRSSLGQLRKTQCTLSAELDMVKSYLLLMQIRMGQRLRYQIEVGNKAGAAVVPPLLLQPLVENAIRHGLEPKVDGGTVRIAASIQGLHLTISVEDDGMGSAAQVHPGSAGNGMALENIRARLQTRYGENATLALEPTPAGTRVTLQIPMETLP
jgi:two-component sensor histidine kinase